MKKIPNIITISRILFSIVLLLFKPLSISYLLVYSICGISDMLDGYIARRTGSTSSFGSMLDSIADIVFMCAAIVTLLPVLRIPKGILIWILMIGLVKIISLAVVYFKFHAFAILHTYANKLTGLLLFCCPFLCLSIGVGIIGCVICMVASVAAIQELVINLVSTELKRDPDATFSKNL